MKTKACKIENCTSPIKAHEFCEAHYRRLKRYGDPLGGQQTFRAVTKIAGCSHAGCVRHHYAKGLCKLHYVRSTTGKNKECGKCLQCAKQLSKPDAKYCSVSCTTKWNRKHGYLREEVVVGIRGCCSIEGCTRAKQSHGMCGPHRTAFIKYGDALFSKRAIEAVNCSRCGKEMEREVGSEPLCEPCYHIVYYHKNLKTERARRSARRSTVKHATPPWADREAIRKIYENCPVGHHVDHDIPLRGWNVSGLHVETNLRYLPDSENRRKNNAFDGVTAKRRSLQTYLDSS